MPWRPGQHNHEPPDRGIEKIRRFRSLPARITFFVFAATVLTSLTITAISVNSISSFLRTNIEKKFPSMLVSAGQRLDLWYDQRVLEIEVFANSEILRENLIVRGDRLSPKSVRARSEIEQYLSYVLDSFQQYEALFLLDRKGRRVHWVGQSLDLPDSMRDRAANLSQPGLGALEVLDGQRAQLATAPIADGRGNAIGSLHALLRASAIDSILAASAPGSNVKTAIVNADGSIVASSDHWLPDQSFARALPDPDSLPEIQDYLSAEGERIVGSSVGFARFGWTLVVEEAYDRAFAPVVSSISRILAINLAIVLLVGLTAYRIAVSIVRPIEALSDAAERIAEGEDNVPIPESRTRDEVGLLTRAFNSMTVKLASRAREVELSRRDAEDANQRLTVQNEELHRVNEILEQLSITDGLTRLHNHRFFQDHLAREVKRADRTGQPLALILADIDRFKAWNDRLGHSVGDEILRQVAEVMNGVIRETDMLARYGGEEFALIGTNTDLPGAVQLAEKIRTTIASHTFMLDSAPGDEPVTVSFGVSVYAGDRKAFFNDADRALYAAKAAGRDCVIAADGLDSKPSRSSGRTRRRS